MGRQDELVPEVAPDTHKPCSAKGVIFACFFEIKKCRIAGFGANGCCFMWRRAGGFFDTCHIEYKFGGSPCASCCC